MQIGAQFYTLREQCKTLEDFAESLKRVADIGYRTVQISGVCAYEPEWLQEQLQKNGLRCVLTHIPQERLEKEPERVAAEHTVFGCDYIGLGSGRQAPGTEGMDEVIRLAQTTGRYFASVGKCLSYHNHGFEFTRDAGDGETRMAYLVEHTAPEELVFTLDTYWVHWGGAEVVDWIDRLSGRIPCVHLKDMVADGQKEQHMAPVGSGNLPWQKILPALEQAGVRYALVEQDNCYGEDPFACLEKSYRFLRAQGLE